MLFAIAVPYYKALAKALHRDNPAEAFAISELAKARTHIDKQRQQIADGLLTAAERSILQSQENEGAMLSERVALARSQRQNSSTLELTLTEATARRDTIADGVALKHPGWPRFRDPEIFDVAAGFALLGRDAAFVSFLVVGQSILAFTISGAPTMLIMPATISRISG